MKRLMLGLGCLLLLMGSGLGVDVGAGLTVSTGGGNASSAISPPSNFVCRLEPSSLAADFADLDPIDTWVADVVSTKGTECDNVGIGANQPQYVDSCAEFGGAPCADFDGVSDELLSSVFTTNVPLPYSICFVALDANIPAVSAIFGTVAPTWGYLAYDIPSSTMYFFDNTPSGTLDNFTGTGNVFNDPDTGCLTFDSSGDSTLYINGEAANTGSLPGHTQQRTSITIGSTGKSTGELDGRVAEIVLYSRDVSSEISDWYAYTCDAYGLEC